VRGQLTRRFPHRLNRVELRRVGRQAKEHDLVGVLGEPLLPFFLEVVAGAVVDNEEELPPLILGDETLEEPEERMSVENLGELKGEPGIGERDGSEQMCGLALAVGVDARLTAYA
jgi:hypothetical protein